MLEMEFSWEKSAHCFRQLSGPSVYTSGGSRGEKEYTSQDSREQADEPTSTAGQEDRDERQARSADTT